MIYLNALELLRRHIPLPFGWSEVVVGYDFGILSIREIQDWVRSASTRGPEADRLAELDGEQLAHFEATLWAACREETGCRVPRPGHLRWARAQDLWRSAMLREVLGAPLAADDFAEAVETIIDRVGCPDDMSDLLKYGFARTCRTLSADRARVDRFVRDLEERLFPSGDDWPTLVAS
jgi:hypothetical protein